MASSHPSTTSDDDNIKAESSVNKQYACYWLDTCRGQHKLSNCKDFKKEYDHTGKMIYYYSPDGSYMKFDRNDGGNDRRAYNPKAIQRLHLFLYTIRPNGEKEILFGLANGRTVNHVYINHPFLSFPYSKSFKRFQDIMSLAQRTLEWITDQPDILQQGLKSRFIYQHSNVVYPLYLTAEQADILTENFTNNVDLRSLHWFPLTTVLERIADWSNKPANVKTVKNLAKQEFIEPQGIYLGEHELWSVTAACLMYIQEHVPDAYKTFLRV
ncbi:unnamed protein product [Rotaria sp. Silwood2]|nr:unnamed protein product [Rotaria sp. Silwood2]